MFMLMMPEFVVSPTAGCPRQRLFLFEAGIYFPGDSAFREGAGDRPLGVVGKSPGFFCLNSGACQMPTSNPTEVVP